MKRWGACVQLKCSASTHYRLTAAAIVLLGFATAAYRVGHAPSARPQPSLLLPPSPPTRTARLLENYASPVNGAKQSTQRVPVLSRLTQLDSSHLVRFRFRGSSATAPRAPRAKRVPRGAPPRFAPHTLSPTSYRARFTLTRKKLRRNALPHLDLRRL